MMNPSPWVAAALVVAFSGCAQTLRPGPRKTGEVVEVQVEVSGDAAAAVLEAQRQAVAGFFDLYTTTPTTASSLQDFLKRAPSYAQRFRVVSSAHAGGRVNILARALVLYPKLGADLERAGLVKPEGSSAGEGVLLALNESGSGAAQSPGWASDALRRVLLERGYSAVDFSDTLEKVSRKTATKEEALTAARRLNAKAVVVGLARAEPSPDRNMTGYSACRAHLELTALSADGAVLSSFNAEASGVDVAAVDCARKALTAAGEIAAEKLRSQVLSRREGLIEMNLEAAGLGGLEGARKLIAALRRLPKIAAVSLAASSTAGASVRVFVDKLSAEELAAAVLRLDGFSFNVRSVEPNFNYVAVEAREGF